jgi:hypothetical protein
MEANILAETDKMAYDTTRDMMTSGMMDLLKTTLPLEYQYEFALMH